MTGARSLGFQVHKSSFLVCTSPTLFPLWARFIQVLKHLPTLFLAASSSCTLEESCWCLFHTTSDARGWQQHGRSHRLRGSYYLWHSLKGHCDMNNLNLCRLSAVSKGGAVYKWLAKNIHLQDSDWLLIKKMELQYCQLHYWLHSILIPWSILQKILIVLGHKI